MKFLQFFVAFFLLLFVNQTLNAQTKHVFNPANARDGELVEYCHTHLKMNKLLQNPDYAKAKAEDDANFNAALKKGGFQKATIYKIPVVFHVLHINGVENISDEQIFNAVAILNRDFRKQNADTANVHADFQGMPADVEIEFVLATKAPNGTCFKGITRTNSALSYDGSSGSAQVTAIKNGNDIYIGSWPGNKYLNIFVCGEIGGAAGYTTNPSTFSATSMNNGIWILHDYVGSIGTGYVGSSRALTHEVGHWLNLEHTWGPNNNPGTTSSCGTDDGVTDTPNCIGVTDCLLNSNTCNSDDAYWGFAIRDNVENYMDYSYCSKMFTAGQVARMRTAAQQTSTGRANLWSSANLTATGASGILSLCKAEFTSDKTSICLGDQIQFTDDSYNSANSWNWLITPSSGWSFVAGTSATSQNPKILFSSPGSYSIKLTASDGSISDDELKTNFIFVTPQAATLPFWEGFENYTSLANLNNWEVYNPQNNNAFTIENTTSYSGSKCAKLVNFGQTPSNIDDLISAPIDLSVIPSTGIVTLSFRYAYRKVTSATYEYFKVYISSNCGESWALRKTLANNNLSSLTSTTSWKPTQTIDWVTVHMTNVTNTYFTENFKAKFSFEGVDGNNFYLDDINLYAGAPSDNLVTAGIDELIDFENFSLYPNPTDAEFNVQFNVNKQERLRFEIQDLAGKFVRQHFILANEGTNLVSFETTELSKGMYLLKISSASGAKTVQFIVN
ncbi:MAG: M43 family zinc metalloprotease [Flavobacteriia bacterium]|nr:M43 family zinc metalloprotease [Flavobacteriia bacterium]